MDQVVTFDKSLQKRLQEYEEVFSALETVPYSKIQSEWGYYVELTVDPSGWQAIWKIPRLKCEALNIPFPTVVLVYVLNINFPELTALVRILAVQDDDVSIPEKHQVPLAQLWLTKDQDKTIALNISSTSNTLDMLRFFYIHLIMTWDEDEDIDDWKGVHLENRLRLHYDLKNGKIPKHTTEHIYALLNEARRLNTKRKIIDSYIEERYDKSYLDEEEIGQNDNTKENLIEINVRLMEIQHEINLLENPMFRKVILKRQTVSLASKEYKSTMWVVFKKGTTSEYISFLQKIDAIFPNAEVSSASDFINAIETGTSNDTILLNESVHQVRNQGALVENHVIRGVGNRNNIEVISQVEQVMFDCVGEKAHFENLTIDSKLSQYAVVIRKGKVVLKDCHIFGNKSSSTLQGILVLAGAELVLENCKIKGFYVGIVGNTNSKITIENSKISGAQIGIKIYDECSLTLKNSTIKDCQHFGLVFETEKDYEVKGNEATLEVLNKIPQFNIENSTATNNAQCDFMVNLIKIKAIENLFANPDLDPTILESDDEEMDTSVNNTIIEVSACATDE